MNYLLKLFALLSAGVICMNSNSNSQSTVLATNFGGVLDDRVFSIGFDLNMNVYSVGFFQDIVDFDPGPGVFNLIAPNQQSIFISKHNTSMDWIWTKMIPVNLTFGGEPFPNLATDSIGNIYITGGFMGTVDFDPGPSVFNMSSNGNYDIFLIKLDSNGNLIWAHSFGSSGNDRASGIAIYDNDQIAITGTFSNTVDFDPGIPTLNLSSGSGQVFVCAYSLSGAINYGQALTGDYGTSIAYDVLGNTLVSGMISNDFLLAKLNTTGALLWQHTIGGSLSELCYSIDSDEFGNIITTGFYSDTVDFDPGVGVYNMIVGPAAMSGYEVFILKLDPNGNFIWAKDLNGAGHAGLPPQVRIDENNNICITNHFEFPADFDPGAGISSLISYGAGDVYILFLDNFGDFIKVDRMGGPGDDRSRCVMPIGNRIYSAGFFNQTGDFDPGPDTLTLNGNGSYDCYILKTRNIFGQVYNDFNLNCIKDNVENGIGFIDLLIEPGSFMVTSSSNGIWFLDSLPDGNYTITVDTTNSQWTSSCSTVQSFNIVNGVGQAPSFGLQSNAPCPQPVISIISPLLRRCVPAQPIYVSACNANTTSEMLDSAYVDLILDTLFNVQSSSIPFTSIGNNSFRFQLGDIFPGQCINFEVFATVSCNAILNQTLCMEAKLFPADTCVFDTIPSGGGLNCTLAWDKSSLHVDGYCQNDSVYFVIYNTGDPVDGDMVCYSQVRIFVDGVLTQIDSVQIAGGDSLIFILAGTGQTIRLEVDQHPLHPGNSHPNAVVELCGNIANWTPGLVNAQPQDDSDPVIDIYCALVIGSYDPNDKVGYPTGVTANNFIYPNQQIQYLIRFQNTGNDTAFTIVLRDTLDPNLNIFTVTPGVSSHDYLFQIKSPRVLQWTFDNIFLPDSNVNLEGSNGFVSYTVEQNPNLPDNTIILNDADIYFDNNAPVTTNQTTHTINSQILILSLSEIIADEDMIIVYPNPSSESFNIKLIDMNNKIPLSFHITEMNGKRVESGNINSNNNELHINASHLKSGNYFIKIVFKNGDYLTRKIIILN